MISSLQAFIKSYLFFFISMIGLKFLFLRYLLFNDLHIFNIVWYELSIVIVLFAIIELLFKKRKIILYIILNILLSSAFFGMVVYERYFETIPSYYDLGQLDQLGSVSESVLLLVSAKDALFFVDLLLLGILLLLRKYVRFPVNNHFTRKAASIILIMGLLIASFNFMFHRNERILDNALFASNNGILNFQMIKPYREYTMHHDLGNITVDDIIRQKGNEPVPFTAHDQFGIAEGKNLIVLQIESLQNFVIDLEIAGQEITPNINEWKNESIYFTNVFQQIGAGNTSDAEFIMNTSIYPKGDTPTSKHIEDKEIPSLPRMLKEVGYHTSTFHAHTIEYWDRDIMYPVLGFDEYYDIDFFGEEDIVGFGPSDGHFYNKVIEELIRYKDTKEPFYSHLLTLTSHTPFEMPEEKSMLKLPKAYKDTLIGNYLQSVHYADAVLGTFFNDLKEAGLWEESVITLYGDHSGVHGELLKSEDTKLLNELLGHPYSLVNRFNIPLFIDVPGVTSESGEQIDKIGGHLDMMPTVLNLLGVEPEGLYFGHNLLQYEHNLLGMRYYLSAGAFFNDDLLFIPETSRFDIRMYDLKGMNRYKDIEDPMEEFAEDYEGILQIYDWSDAYFESLTKDK